MSDTGVGIPPGERAQVFERFYRASNARTTGSGLGLAIVREVRACTALISPLSRLKKARDPACE